MTTNAARTAVEEDASGMGWSTEDLVRFRHCFALLGEESGLERVRFTPTQRRLFPALPRSVRCFPDSTFTAPRLFARFLDWWRLIEGASPLYLEELDLVRAAFVYVTDTEQRRAWLAVAELAGRLDPVMPFIPRHRRA